MILRLRMPSAFSIVALVLVSQALVFGTQGLAVTHRVSLRCNDEEWSEIVRRAHEGDHLIFEMEQGPEQRFVLGAELSEYGAHGRVFRLESPQDQLVKLNRQLRRPNGGNDQPSWFQRITNRIWPAPAVEVNTERDNFENEAFHLSNLDGTGVYHPRVLQNIRNMAMTKDYIDGVLFTDFFRGWHHYSLNQRVQAIRKVVELVTILEARRIYIGDPQSRNLVFQRRTFNPYVIDPGFIQIDYLESDFVPGKYAENVLNHAIRGDVPRSAAWVGLLEPASLVPYLRIEILLNSNQLPTPQMLEALIAQIPLLNPEHDLRVDPLAGAALEGEELRLKKRMTRFQVALALRGRLQHSPVMSAWLQSHCSDLLSR